MAAALVGIYIQGQIVCPERNLANVMLTNVPLQ